MGAQNCMDSIFQITVYVQHVMKVPTIRFNRSLTFPDSLGETPDSILSPVKTLSDDTPAIGELMSVDLQALHTALKSQNMEGTLSSSQVKTIDEEIFHTFLTCC